MPKAADNARTIKELIQAQRAENAEREKEERLKYATNLRVLNRGAKYEVESAVAEKAWNQLFETVKNLKSEWQRGYNNDYVTSTYAMMLMLDEFFYALQASKPIASLFAIVLDPLSDVAVNFFNERTYSSPPQEVLPKLLFHTEFTEDNQLTVASLSEMRRTDGQPMFPNQSSQEAQQYQGILRGQLEKQLQNCVKGWLGDLGYESTKDGHFIDKATKKELTKDRFEHLRDHGDRPNQSLVAVLKGEFDMDFELAPKPRP